VVAALYERRIIFATVADRRYSKRNLRYLRNPRSRHRARLRIALYNRTEFALLLNELCDQTGPAGLV